jgi:hypothetical protein
MNFSTSKVSSALDVDYVQVEDDKIVHSSDHSTDDIGKIVGIEEDYDDLADDEEFILVPSEPLMNNDELEHISKSDVVLARTNNSCCNNINETCLTDGRIFPTSVLMPENGIVIIPPTSASSLPTATSLIASSMVQKRKKKTMASTTSSSSSSIVANNFTEILNNSKLTNKSLSPAIFLALLLISGSTFWWFYSLSIKVLQHNHPHPLESSRSDRNGNRDVVGSSSLGHFVKNGTMGEGLSTAKVGTPDDASKQEMSKSTRQEIILTDPRPSNPLDLVVNNNESTESLLSSYLSRSNQRRRQRNHHRRTTLLSFQRLDHKSNSKIDIRNQDMLPSKKDAIRRTLEDEKISSLLQPKTEVHMMLYRRLDSTILQDAGLVTMLNFKNFGSFFVGQTNPNNSRILMVFYQPSDDFDRNIAPFINNLASQSEKKVGVVNCVRYQKICQDHLIDRFPTIRWYYQQERMSRTTSTMERKLLYDEMPISTLQSYL